MNPTLEVLEKYGLITPTLVKDFIYGLSVSAWNDFIEELNESLQVKSDVVIEREHDLTPFNFVASSSIPGETGCSEERCRLAKIVMLGGMQAYFATV